MKASEENKKPVFHKKIWLQVDPEGDKPTGDYFDSHEVTWCQDKINSNDLEYILASEVESQRKEWISVEDGLPEKSGKYNVAYDDGFGVMKSNSKHFSRLKQKFTTGHNVLYWQELPEPPKN